MARSRTDLTRDRSCRLQTKKFAANMTAIPKTRSPATSTSFSGVWKQLGLLPVRQTSGAMRLASATATATAFKPHLPATACATQRGEGTRTIALQVPDSTLRGLAARSITLGAGSYLAPGPRLLTAAAVTPALVNGATILLRPSDGVPAVANR